MSTLAARLSARIDTSIIAAIAPKPPQIKAANQKAIITAFADMLPAIFEVAEINTPLRIQHILAQVAHESDSFCTLEEYASGAAYENRKDLGNIMPGDGTRFKGRGLIQLTGRANYRAFTAWMRKREANSPDFERNPELVVTWSWAGWALAFYWQSRPALNLAADRDDLIAVTKIVNGGKNGLDDRAAFLAKAKAEFLSGAKSAVTRQQGLLISADQQFLVIHRGMVGPSIEDAQRRLATAGFYLMSIDGDFGAGTEAAVKAFQRANGLLVDGIVGAKTAEALMHFEPIAEAA